LARWPVVTTSPGWCEPWALPGAGCRTGPSARRSAPAPTPLASFPGGCIPTRSASEGRRQNPRWRFGLVCCWKPRQEILPHTPVCGACNRAKPSAKIRWPGPGKVSGARCQVSGQAAVLFDNAARATPRRDIPLGRASGSVGRNPADQAPQAKGPFRKIAKPRTKKPVRARATVAGRCGKRRKRRGFPRGRTTGARSRTTAQDVRPKNAPGPERR
jgi:hypothetical protein